jgi:hypothetical protein
MLLYYIEKMMSVVAGRESEELILWADNCGGQNKNSTMMKSLLYLTKTGRFRDIQFKFLVKGHTRNSVDRGFGTVKRKFNTSDIWTMRQLHEAIEQCTSHRSIRPVILLNEPAFQFRKYTEFFQDHYSSIVGIQSYQMFRFLKLHSGIVFAKKDAKSGWAALNVALKNAPATFPAICPPKTAPGISAEKQAALFKHVRPYIPEPYRDETCPEPTEAVLAESKNITRRRKDLKATTVANSGQSSSTASAARRGPQKKNIPVTAASSSSITRRPYTLKKVKDNPKASTKKRTTLTGAVEASIRPKRNVARIHYDEESSEEGESRNSDGEYGGDDPEVMEEDKENI